MPLPAPPSPSRGAPPGPRGGGLAGLPWTARLVGVLAAATVVARLPGLWFNGLFDRDEAFLNVMGDVMRSGGTLYVDVIDRKPPLVPLVYELARDLSVDMRMVRLLCAVAVLVNGVLVALLVRRLSASPRAALAAGVLAVLGTSWFLPSDAQAANFELWGLAPATGAVLRSRRLAGQGGHGVEVVPRRRRARRRGRPRQAALRGRGGPGGVGGLPGPARPSAQPGGRGRRGGGRHPPPPPRGRPGRPVALGLGRQRRLPRRRPLHRPGPRDRPRSDRGVPVLPPAAALRVLGGDHPTRPARPRPC